MAANWNRFLFLILFVPISVYAAPARRLIEVGPAAGAGITPGLMIVYRRDDLVLALVDSDEAAPKGLLRDLGPADDGMEHYLLAPRRGFEEAVPDCRILARYGDELLVAIPPGTVERLIPWFHPVRIFHRPLPTQTGLERLLPAPGPPDPDIQALVAAVNRTDYESIHQDIYQNDGYPNRYATSSGGANAQNKIMGYFQSFGYTDVSLFNVPGFSTRDVVCKLPGATTPNVVYILGGHYDTVSTTKGADDNGSGTTGVLEAAKAIGSAYQAGLRFDSTIIFIAFTAEEWGLYGSDAYASWAKNQGMDVRGMLNMDMIGYVAPGDAIDLDTIAKNPPESFNLQTLALQVVADYLPGFAAVTSNSASVAYQSDQASFWQQGFAALFLFEDGWDYCPYIHTSGDNIGQGLNDYDFAVNNTKAATALLATLAQPTQSVPPPTAAFSGSPTSGTAPLSVDFTDLSTGQVVAWSWNFGDGGTSTMQNPTHLYTTAGTYDVCLQVSGPGGSDSLCKPGYIQVSGGGTTLPFELVTGAGEGPSNAPEVRVFNAARVLVASFVAYGTPGYGADVAAGNVDTDSAGEIVTGPGPSDVYGPHLRGFEALGAPIANLSLFAYGTLRYGVKTALPDADGDGFDEIVSGAGPGAVFGPHVRGFDFDGTAPSALPGFSFYAYKTLKFGVNPSAGDLDGDSLVEILSGPGPGAVFGSQVRGFSYAGQTIAPVSGVNFMAYPSFKYGATVAAGDVDADAADEILSGPGPSPAYLERAAGFDYGSGAIGALFSATTDTSHYGTHLSAGDLDTDGRHEIVAVQGPDPATTATCRGFSYSGGTLNAFGYFVFQPYGNDAYGANLAMEDLGSY